MARTLGHLLWAAISFLLAAAVALAALYLLGALWVADELRALDPDDPLFRHGGASVFGMVLFAAAVTPALTILPALAAVIVGEALRIRSWSYYVLAGGVSLLAVPLLAAGAAAWDRGMPQGQYLAIFATAGFAGGFVYWLLAGRNA